MRSFLARLKANKALAEGWAAVLIAAGVLLLVR